MKRLSNGMMPMFDKQLAAGDSHGPLFWREGWALTALSREGTGYLAEILPGRSKCRKVMAPAYTCDTVALPFLRQGWKAAYFPLDEHLRIRPEPFLEMLDYLQPDAVVAHPYSGQELNGTELELLAAAKAKGAFVIEDLTQCVHTAARYDCIDAYVGSVRKWYGMPDGGFLEMPRTELPDWERAEEHDAYVSGMREAMTARGIYLKTGDRAYLERSCLINEERGEAGEERNPIRLHRMSDYSRRILAQEDMEQASLQRLKNARYLFEHLKDSEACRPVFRDVSDITTGPLFFPIYVENRVFMRSQRLEPNGIDGIPMWMQGDIGFGLHDRVGYNLYFKTVHLPVGQMYTEEDMQYMVDALEGKL